MNWKLRWEIKSFHELTNTELYECLKLRQIVFSWEQHCAYIDCDDKDAPAWHLMGFQDRQLAAYCRILPAGVAFDELSIGRIITHPKYRKLGFGKELIEVALQEVHRKFGAQTIRIGAQKWLSGFYRQYGFVEEDICYLEDGIPHVIMRRE